MLSGRTISFVVSLLVQQLNIEKSRMMDAIDNGFNREHVDDCIRRYRAAKAARDEFCEWADGQEDEDSEEADV